MHITKMHGLGNDFIVIEERVKDAAALARKLCPRRVSVGADGLLLVEPSEIADVKMRIINADGSEAEMCGNGIRCFARYVYEKGIVTKEEMAVETLAGVMKPRLVLSDGRTKAVRVDMGVPSFAAEAVPVLAENPLDFEVCGVRAASVLCGVPHTMVLVENLADTEIDQLGPRIEQSSLFPRKTNVNFVEQKDGHTAYMRTWERGAGQTLACGTGATGCAALLHRKGLAGSEIDMHVPAGTLHIELAPDGHAYMTGAAEYVFEGETVLTE